jgi:hypothetical protein
MFDDHAKTFSAQKLMNLKLMTLRAHRGVVALTGVALTGLVFAALRKKRGQMSNEMNHENFSPEEVQVSW